MIWIGTAGDGIYTYSYDPFTIKSNLYSDHIPSVSMPVSAICSDDNGGIWLGTLGDGIIILPNYDINKEVENTHILSEKNGLPDNVVHSFSKAEDGIWIGCKSGLAFYSYRDQAITKLDNAPFHNIYAIYEHDSTLWLACYGVGIVKTKIAYDGKKIKVNDVKVYSINNADKASNRFSSIFIDKENLWFTNTGNGIYKFVDDSLISIEFADWRFNSINHIGKADNNNYIASTDFGTVKFEMNSPQIESIIINNTSANSITKGLGDDYWFGTDNGLILYNPVLESSRYFDTYHGLTITEYSDGASYNDENNKTLFLGGINGFTAIKYNYYDEAMDYMPILFPEKFSLFGVEHNINDFRNNDSDRLILKSNENFFTVTFNALDYINGNNYTYYYKIGESGKWIDNGNSGIISFTDINPGKYDLYVRYYNKMLNKESYAQTLQLTILPPWYRGVYAIGIYSMLILLRTPSKWFGVTYAEDRPEVVQRILELVEEGIYPTRLF